MKESSISLQKHVRTRKGQYFVHRSIKRKRKHIFACSNIQIPLPFPIVKVRIVRDFLIFVHFHILLKKYSSVYEHDDMKTAIAKQCKKHIGNNP